MCFRVDCKQCGKYSRGGCCRHLSSVYANIEMGKHCMCRSWPGVVIPVDLIGYSATTTGGFLKLNHHYRGLGLKLRHERLTLYEYALGVLSGGSSSVYKEIRKEERTNVTHSIEMEFYNTKAESDF